MATLKARLNYLVLAHCKINSVASGLKSQLYKALFHWACNGPASHLVLPLLKKRNWQPIGLESTSACTTVTVAEQGAFVVEAPRWDEKMPLIRFGVFPKVRAHVFVNGMVSAYSSAVISNGKLHLPKHILKDRTRIMTDSGSLFAIGSRFAVGRIKADSEIDGGIFVGGAGAFNWYHFIIECLPKVFMARGLPYEFDHLPLLVPGECQSIPSFADALAIFSAGRSLRFISRGESLSVKRLVIMDDISIGPFNLVPGEWPRIGDYRQHDDIMRSFIATFRSGLLEPSKKLANERRIFLKRPGLRRNYNQDELIRVAKRYGFDAVSAESLSLREQAVIFAEASAVVGPSGAAWVGMIFRERPLCGLSWLPRPYEQFCSYSTLSRLLGHRLNFIEAKTQQILRSTGEAYSAKYLICPVDFESALKTMIGDL